MAMLPVSSPVAPQAVEAATVRVGPFGTAAIDGVQAPGEWDAAAAVPFRITMSPAAGGTGADATLFVMNNARNLYLALRVAAVYDRLTVSLSFDRDRDGDAEVGDDRLEVELGRSATTPGLLVLRDQFVGYCGTNRCPLDDTQAGSGNPPAGTNDGRAAGAFDLTSGYLELVHPLAGPDAGHDIHLALGAAVGFRFEARVMVGSGYGSGAIPVQDCSSRPCSGYSDLVIATTGGRISTPQEVVQAIRVEALRVSPSAALPGARPKATFRVVNRSTRTLVVPLDPSGWYLGGWLEQSLLRLGPDQSIGARNATGPVRLADQPIDILARLGGTSWPPGASIAFAGDASELSTSGYPPGDYRYTVRRYAQPAHSPPAQTSTTQFALKGVAHEWRASVGSGGRNGAATLRAWTTDDGSLGLTLRGLSARASYPVTVRSGSCSGTVVASAGTVTASASGAVTRTVALSRSKMAAIQSASTRGRIVLRVGTGSPARCGTLVVVPLYEASLVWRMQRLPGTENEPGGTMPRGAMPASIAATSSTLVIAGQHFKNDRPPTRRATAVWISQDGSSWSEQILGADTGPGLVAAGSGRLVVVASGAAWWSTDGRTWIASGSPPVSTVEQYWSGGSGQVTATDAGFIAVLPTQPGPAGCRSAAWTSTDGRAWEQLPFDRDLACLEARDVLAAHALIVVAGSDPEVSGAAIAISRDRGATWERAAVGTAAARATVINTVMATPAGYVAYGRLDGGRIGVWTSGDALTWRATSSVAPYSWYDFSWAADAVPFGPGFVLVGGSAAAADSLSASVLTSGDATTLRWAPSAPQLAESPMAASVAWNGRLYVTGTGGAFFLEPAVPLVWTADLGPLP